MEEKGWFGFRKILYHSDYDCDKSLWCENPRSGQFCCTSQYKKCPYYKHVKKGEGPEQIILEIRKSTKKKK